MISTLRRRLHRTPLAGAFVLLWAPWAHASSIHVNDPSEGSAQGSCTLLDAVTALNTATAVGGCVAGNGSDDTIDLSFFTAPTVIGFAAAHSLDGNSAFEFNRSARIAGPLGSNGKPLVTIERSAAAAADFRVMASSADLSLSGVTISGGHIAQRGAGVYVTGHANLTLTDSVVSGNTAIAPNRASGGGLSASYGDITLTRSTVDGNTAAVQGGGIYMQVSGTVTLIASTVSNNTANNGGGIFNFNGNVDLIDSTVSGNYANDNTAVQYPPFGAGGGIYVYRAVHMTNSTIVGNRCTTEGGGIYAAVISQGRPPLLPPLRPLIGASAPAHPKGAVYMYFSTVANNYAPGAIGGVSAQGYLRMVGSILANNDYTNTFAGYGQASGFTGNNNLIFGDPVMIGPPPNEPADTLHCDPLLGALADNGGPTQTLALGSGSCAIDAGPAFAPSTVPSDQRGAKFARRVGNATDIGAVEQQTAGERIFYDGFGT